MFDDKIYFNVMTLFHYIQSTEFDIKVHHAILLLMKRQLKPVCGYRKGGGSRPERQNASVLITCLFTMFSSL